METTIPRTSPSPSHTESKSALDHRCIRDEVRAASETWIAAFNRGDVQEMVAGYEADAEMVAAPEGVFKGRGAIRGFWRSLLIDGDPGELAYENVAIEVEDRDTAHLAASWRMTRFGCGVITRETWVRGSSGRWQLREDHFEVVEVF